MPLSACSKLHKGTVTSDTLEGEKLHEPIDVILGLSPAGEELPENPVELLVDENSCHLLHVECYLLKILLALGIVHLRVGH